MGLSAKGLERVAALFWLDATMLTPASPSCRGHCTIFPYFLGFGFILNVVRDTGMPLTCGQEVLQGARGLCGWLLALRSCRFCAGAVSGAGLYQTAFL